MSPLALKLEGKRYFGNPFFANVADGANPIDREWLLRNLQALSKRIVARKISTEEYEQRDGPYVGPSGIAYALHRVSKIAAEEGKHQFNFQEVIHSILKKQAKHTSEDSISHQSRYLTGTLGFRTVQCVTKQIDVTGFTAKFRKLIPRVSQPGNQKSGDDEMMQGRAGFLAAVLEIRSQLDDDVLPNEEIRPVLDAMVISGRKYSKNCKSPASLMFAWHDSEYLGAAHGVVGIYQILLSFWHLLDESARSDLKQSIEWLLSLQSPDGNFPTRPDKEDMLLLHWCHGAPGAVHMLIIAHLVLKEFKYLEAAEKCANLIWKKGILHKGPGICHGVAGNGYTFLLLYRLTRNNEYLEKAKAFARVMMDSSFESQARTPDRPWSLFEGWSGSLCFLVDLLNSAKAQFPMIPIAFPASR